MSEPEFMVVSLMLTVASQPTVASSTTRRTSRGPNTLTYGTGKAGLSVISTTATSGASVATEPQSAQRRRSDS